MLAFVFPGQGSQFVGMGKSLYEKYDYVREIFKTAEQVLDFDITKLIFEGPAEELQKTVNAQPAILTVSMAIYELIKRTDIQPRAVAGHSLGEYSALVTAGSIKFSDAVRLVRRRGQFMQEAVPYGEGGMMAVLGLTPEQIDDGCRQVSQVGIVEAANFNCPGQVVVAGKNGALKCAEEIFKKMGARRCIPLQVSAPFHSSMMISAGEKLINELDRVEIKDPSIPVVANINAGYVKTAEDVRDALSRQVSGPVLWQQSIDRLIADGYDLFVEVGPGQVLSGLVKKISRNIQTVNFHDVDHLDKVIARLKEAV